MALQDIGFDTALDRDKLYSTQEPTGLSSITAVKKEPTDVQTAAVKRGIPNLQKSGARATGFQGGQIDTDTKNLRDGKETDAGVGQSVTPVDPTPTPSYSPPTYYAPQPVYEAPKASTPMPVAAPEPAPTPITVAPVASTPMPTVQAPAPTPAPAPAVPQGPSMQDIQNAIAAALYEQNRQAALIAHGMGTVGMKNPQAGMNGGWSTK